MTSETHNLHVSKNLTISKTKQDIEKLKTPLRLVWKCCFVALEIGSTIFSLQGNFDLYFLPNSLRTYLNLANMIIFREVKMPMTQNLVQYFLLKLGLVFCGI